MRAVTDRPQDSALFRTFLIVTILFLVVARSSLMPESIAFVTPVLVGLALIVGLLSFGPRLRIPVSMLGMLLLTMLLVVSTGAREGTSDTAKALGIGLMWSTALLCGWVMDAKMRQVLVRFLLIVAAIETGVAVLESLVNSEVVRTFVAGTTEDLYIVRDNTILGDWTNRAQGTLGYPIPLAHLLSLAWVMAAVSGAVRGPWQWALVAWLTLGIALTGTRTALVAVVVAVLVFIIVRRRKQVMAVLAAVIAGAVGVVVLINYLALAEAADDASFTHRVGVIQAAQQLFDRDIQHVLFGSGVNSQSSLVGAIFKDGVTGAVDNAYITVFISAGLLGFLVFLSYFLTAFVVATPATRAILALFGVFFFSYDAVWWHLIAVLFWITVGTAFGERRDRRATAVLVDLHQLRQPRLASKGAPVAKV